MSGVREGVRVSNYLLETRLGQGSFGEVWRARHHVLDHVVAIKIPTDVQYVRNLQREGVAAHGLQHPNVVRALDLDPYADPPYLVMEFVDGPSLRAAIDRYGQTFPIPAAVKILEGMLRGLQAAHAAGLIHRDVKPANVLLRWALEDLARIDADAVKVTDFGLGVAGGDTTRSIMQSGSLLTEEGRSIAGTLAYMSPEQKEHGELDGRSDLYSCGIVLFEMLTGERPQGTDRPSALRPEVPASLDAVFERSYTRLERRYRSAQEMLAALLSGAASPPPLPRAAKKAMRCPTCDQPVEPADQFCIACGSQLVDSVPRCEACGAFVRPSDRYCIFCGNELHVFRA